VADAAYCQTLTVDGDGCVCITRQAAEKMVTGQKVEKLEQQSMAPELTIGTTIVLSVGFLLGVLFCGLKKIF